jgi:predicted AAA+ superfamily ATPase
LPPVNWPRKSIRLIAQSWEVSFCVKRDFNQGDGVYYWREGEKEVDFVVQHGKSISAIEVKSVSVRGSLSGMDDFAKKFKPKKMLLVGGDGIPVEDLLGKPIASWIK